MLGQPAPRLPFPGTAPKSWRFGEDVADADRGDTALRHALLVDAQAAKDLVGRRQELLTLTAIYDRCGVVAVDAAADGN